MVPHRIPSLDGLRAISIVFVLLAHLTKTVHYPQNAFCNFFLEYGNFGVHVFFVLSGFLITSLLLEERKRGGRISLTGFYRRRAYRILPASVVYTTVALMVTISMGEHPSLPYGLAVYGFSVGYVKHGLWQFAHLWSLGAEEQFYLFWPLALVLWFRARTLMAVGVIAFSAWWRFHGLGHTLYSFPAVADSMAVGCLTAIHAERLCRLPRWCWSAPAALLLCVTILALAPVFHTRNTLFWAAEPLLIAVTMFCLIQRADRVLNNRLAAYVGGLSYTLYLTQQPFLNRASHAALTAFPLNIVCAVSTALALHYLVELPCLRLREDRAAIAVRTPTEVLPAA